MISECKYLEVGMRRFYKAFAGEASFLETEKVLESTGYVPLRVKPNGEYMAVSPTPSNAELSRLIRDYLKRENDEFGDPGLTNEEYNQIVHDKFIENLTRRPDGRYVIHLPWNDRCKNVSNNRLKAFSRMKMLEGQFSSRKPEFEKFYSGAIKELKELGFLKKIPLSYLDQHSDYALVPHHAVIKEHRETTKYRVVFAANEKERGGYSLNEALDCGPNLLKVIHTVLMRIRKGKYMFTQDLQKCFFQLQLAEDNPIKILILWSEYDEVLKERVRELLMFIRMPWGTNTSMFCILAVIIHHVFRCIERVQETDPKEADRLRRMISLMYVDDIIEVEQTEEDCVQGALGNIEAFASAAMKVTRTRSNSPLVQEKFPEHARDPAGNIVTKQGVLGMNWNMVNDTLEVNYDRIDPNTWQKPFTKRKALAMLATFYDPLDIMAPYYFVFKMMYREVEELSPKEWDKDLGEQLFEKWKAYFESHTTLKGWEFPRNVIPWNEEFDVIIFCDASNDGYGAVAYVIHNGVPVIFRAMSQIIGKKDRNKRSSSHQELQAAMLALKIRKQIEVAFPNGKITFYHFTDNLSVLCWIQNEVVHPEIYISNRTEKIWKASQVEEWIHVPGKENPADLASRGMNASDLSKKDLWFRGPLWLSESKDKWPQFKRVSTKEAPEALLAVRGRIKHRKMMAADLPTIDSSFEHLRNSNIKFDQLGEAFALLTRWLGIHAKGKLLGIARSYKNEREKEDNVTSKHIQDRTDVWLEKLRQVTKLYWNMPERKWKGKDMNKPELTLSVFSQFFIQNPPEFCWRIITPDERVEAGSLLVRETQQHYFPNFWKFKGTDIIPEELNSIEKKIQRQFIVSFDERMQILLVSGRVTEQTPRIKAFTRAAAQREQEKMKQEAADAAAVLLAQEEAEKDSETDHDEEQENQHIAEQLPFPDGYNFDDIDGLKPVILLPGKGLVAESVIRDAHERCGHGGNQKILRICREQAWIDAPSILLKRVQDTCRNCRFMRAKLLIITEGMLPKDRTRCTRPFSIVGIDMAGPIFMSYEELNASTEPPNKRQKMKESPDGETAVNKTKKGRHKTSGAHKQLQLYVLIVTCCNTRAVNVQICQSLNALEISKAFECFVAERGRPERVISDNAQQFKQLKRLYQEAVRMYLSPRYPRIYWKFIPSRSPWWGGFYESLIRPFKNTIRTMLPRMRVRNALHAHRICKQAEACLNHRPLWAESRTDNSISAVTPFQFLSVEVDASNADFHTNDVESEILKQLKSAQTTAMCTLWYKVRMSLLTELQKFHDRRTMKSERVLKVNDLVIMKNDWSARSYWPIAKVTKVLPDQNGVIRSVEVSKYVPNAINAELSKSLFGIQTEGKLTRRQLRQVTGFFKPMATAQAVRNLVRFELWNPEDLDKSSRGAFTVHLFGKFNTLPAWYKPRIERFLGVPKEKKNEVLQDYEPLGSAVPKLAAFIVQKNNDYADETPLILVRKNRIKCGV
jgi:hypothetical protein